MPCTRTYGIRTHSHTCAVLSHIAKCNFIHLIRILHADLCWRVVLSCIKHSGWVQSHDSYVKTNKQKNPVNYQCVSLFHSCLFVAQVMTQRIIGSPRKRGHEDLHLQSCGALSSSPSMRRPKHLPQTTSASTNPLDSPSSEQSLECKETILWPLSQQGLGSKLWGHFRLLMLPPGCAVQQMSLE